MRSTMYKDIDSGVLAGLASVGNSLGLDAKGTAAAFDKFMTISKCVPPAFCFLLSLSLFLSVHATVYMSACGYV